MGGTVSLNIYDKIDLNQNKSSEIVEYFKNNQHKVNELDQKRKIAPMHHAIILKNDNLLELLISLHANINIQDHDGATPLYLTIQYNYICGINILLRNGANINRKNILGQTPLYASCIYNNYECFILLLNAGADIIIPDNQGNTVLHASIYSSTTKFLEIILNQASKYLNKYLNKTNNDMRTALIIACKLNKPIFLSLLIKANAKVFILDKYNNNAFHYTANKYECLELIIKHEKSFINHVNNNGETAIFLSNNIDCCKLLINNGADINNIINKDGKSLLLVTLTQPCYCKCNLSVYNMLHNIGETILYPTITSYLCKDTCDFNIINNYNHISSKVHFLLQSGINVTNIYDLHGNSPMNIIAAANTSIPYIFNNKDKLEIIKLLINYNIDLITPNYSNKTPYMSLLEINVNLRKHCDYEDECNQIYCHDDIVNLFKYHIYEQIYKNQYINELVIIKNITQEKNNTNLVQKNIQLYNNKRNEYALAYGLNITLCACFLSFYLDYLSIMLNYEKTNSNHKTNIIINNNNNNNITLLYQWKLTYEQFYNNFQFYQFVNEEYLIIKKNFNSKNQIINDEIKLKLQLDWVYKEIKLYYKELLINQELNNNNIKNCKMTLLKLDKIKQIMIDKFTINLKEDHIQQSTIV